MVPASRCSTRDGQSEKKGKADYGYRPANGRNRHRSNSASAHGNSPFQLNSFLGASSPCAAPRPGRLLCSETGQQAARDETPVSHVIAGACGRPSSEAPTTNAADASTSTARLIAARWSPPLGAPPVTGKARRRAKSAPMSYPITERKKRGTWPLSTALSLGESGPRHADVIPAFTNRAPSAKIPPQQLTLNDGQQ
jgi:hypothetical protein